MFVKSKIKLTPARGKYIIGQKGLMLRRSPKIYDEGKCYIVFSVQAPYRLPNKESDHIKKDI